MKIKDLFNLQIGKPLELSNMTYENPKINFISRTSENNGVVAKVDEIITLAPYPKGSITVALGGSVLSSFVQNKDFYTAFHMMVLTPKKEMSLIEKLYYCYLIRMNKYRYSYGRQANKTLKDIELPDKIPNWVYKIDLNKYYKMIQTSVVKKHIPLNIENWKIFSLIDFFDMYAGKYIKDIEQGTTPYVSASDNNNGVMQYIDAEPKFKKNSITIGKVGCVSYYQPNDFMATADVTVLTPKFKEFNQYIGLFVITIINKECYKWSYGRQIRLGDCKELKIKLPTTADNTPNWHFMEDYIKSLPYSDKI